MHPVSFSRRAARGFTLIEIMIGLTILSVLLAMGIPTLGKWMSASRAIGVAEFYAEGLKMARAEALKRNVSSRFSLVANSNGQYDWQIDVCVPDPAAPCRDDSGAWSTTTTAASTDPTKGVSDYLSLARTAKNLPPATAIALTLLPAGADQVYFTPLGWVDSSISQSLNKITIAPAAARAGDFPTSAVAITLAGVVSKCDPTIATGVVDSRMCPQ